MGQFITSIKQDSLAAGAALLKKISDIFLPPSSPEHVDHQVANSADTSLSAAAVQNPHRVKQPTKAATKAQLATAHNTESTYLDKTAIALLPVPPFATPSAPKIPKIIRQGKPVQFIQKTVSRVPLYETIIDLQDPETFLCVGLANNAARANDVYQTHGDESFASLVKKAHAAVVMNGTFFSKDDQKRVMGNMVSGGKFLKYSQWENFGTTFGLTAHNQPVMVTARAEEIPKWNQQWFSMTCGPRLLKNGEIWIHPEIEGFSDSHVLGIGPRCALGFNSTRDKLILCTFMSGLSLPDEARLMKELGCSEALNLDGGASRSLAYNGAIVVPAGRPLTNVLMVYDAKNKAPQSLIKSWEIFQKAPRAETTDDGE